MYVQCIHEEKKNKKRNGTHTHHHPMLTPIRNIRSHNCFHINKILYIKFFCFAIISSFTICYCCCCCFEFILKCVRVAKIFPTDSILYHIKCINVKDIHLFHIFLRDFFFISFHFFSQHHFYREGYCSFLHIANMIIMGCAYMYKIMINIFTMCMRRKRTNETEKKKVDQ